MNKYTYPVLFGLATLVYLLGLNITIMDVDSAQYALISKDMAESGQFLQVQQMGKDYLDKPPLLFWVSALCFKIFGVSNWAFKIGSLLFSILGVWSTYKLGKILYSKEVGLLASLILYSCQAYFLINNDVRTDTILTAAVIFSIWQWVAWLKTKEWLQLIGAGIGIGIAMLAKGPIGLMVPILAVSAYLLGQLAWRDIFNWKYLVMALIAFLVISPMLWGLYHQFDAQPEKTTMMITPQGLVPEKGVSGLKFYLWTQSFGRITGENTWKNNAGPFFFIHNFLWSYLPWALLFILALFSKIKYIFGHIFKGEQPPELLTTLGFILPFVALSMSQFKLPHYIFILYPLASIMVAWWWINIAYPSKIWRNTSLVIQSIVALASTAIIFFIFYSFFPNPPLYIPIISAIFIIIGIYFFMRLQKSKHAIIIASVFISIGVNFVMNTWFYPSVMQYQRGSMIVEDLNQREIPLKNVFTDRVFSFSQYYYSNNKLKGMDSLHTTKKSGDFVYIITPTPEKYKDVELVKEYCWHAVTQLNLKFLNSKTRPTSLKSVYLIKTHLP